MSSTGFRLGYGGWCLITEPKSSQYEYINGAFPPVEGYYPVATLNPQVIANQEDTIMFQVKSASVTQQFNVPSMNSFYLPYQSNSNSVKSPIRLGHGTYSFSGEISFQLTESTLKLLTDNKNNQYGDMFSPTNLFHLQFFDGQNTCTVFNCVWTNFSINCSPGALVTISLNFLSNNGYYQDLLIIEQDLKQQYQFNEKDLLIPYWQTGSHNMIKFQLSFNKSVTPVYLNNQFLTPSYFRQGLITVDLNATYYDSQENYFDDLSIQIGAKKISFNKLVLQNHTYNMSNMQQQGEKTYKWSVISLNQVQPLFVISTVS